MTAQTVFPPVPPEGERPPGPSLSPSRAADFKTCPLLFRFRTIDKLPEQPSADQVRGTLVHAVLERLFDLPAAERTPAAAAALVAPVWEELRAEQPGLAEIFATVPLAPREQAAATPLPAPDAATTLAGPDAVTTLADPDAVTTLAGLDAVTTLAGPDAPAAPLPGRDPAAVAAEADATGALFELDSEPARLAAFLGSATALLEGYFAVEDPTRLEPAERESLVSTLVDDALLIRGYIDRLDVSPAGDLRVVDYKTGGAPREAFEGRALFQLKFYALVLWRTRGVVPKVLRLLYLKDAEICDYSPDAVELERFERTLVALSEAVERAKREQDFRPKPSRLCGWCNHQRFCPEFGGTPPPYPAEAIRPVLDSAPVDDDRLG